MNVTRDSLKNNLIYQFSQLNENEVYAALNELLENGIPNKEIEDCLNEGMKQVGDIFEKGEYFIADLMFSGMIYCSVLEKIRPRQYSCSTTKKGRILTGVVEKDIHDIGKDIVVSLLNADGFDVIDLGTDVSPAAFVEAIRQYHPQVVSLSGMMSFALDSMKRTIEAIEEAGLRDQVTVILGGGCVFNDYALELHADFVSHEPAESLAFCNKIILGEI